MKKKLTHLKRGIFLLNFTIICLFILGVYFLKSDYSSNGILVNKAGSIQNIHTDGIGYMTIAAMLLLFRLAIGKNQ